LAKEEFIPHLACFKFDLNGSKRIKELARKQYKTLIEQAEIALFLFKSAAKKQIVLLVKLEILTAKKAIAKIFCDATGINCLHFCEPSSYDGEPQSPLHHLPCI
jgi:hypothetical protein